MKHLEHPNIVQYKASFIEKGVLIIIMEYCEGKQNELHASWGFGLSHQEEEERRGQFYRAGSHELVHSNSNDSGVHPREKDLALRHQTYKHLPDWQQYSEAWGFWDFESSRVDM